MKIRTGFVSNSSSSSYVLVAKVDEACPHCGRHDLNIIKLLATIAKAGSDSVSVRVQGKQKVVAYLQEGLDDELAWLEENPTYSDGTPRIYEDEELDERRAHIAKIQALPDDVDIALTTIDHNDMSLEVLIDQAIKDGSVKDMTGILP